MKIATQIILAVIFCSLVAYDVLAYLVGGPESTISGVTYEFSEFASFPFAFGVLTGHIFLPLKTGAREAGEKLLGLGGLLAVAAGLFAMDRWIPEFHGRNLFMLASGLAAGRYFWPQTVDRPR